MKDGCIFCKIGSGEIPGLRIYENEYSLAFMDLAGDYDGHILVIPKEHFENIMECPEDIMKEVMASVRLVSRHLVDNCGYDGVDIMSANGAAAGQSLYHLHIHIIPRRKDDGLGGIGEWPTPKGAKEDVRAVYEKLRIK